MKRFVPKFHSSTATKEDSKTVSCGVDGVDFAVEEFDVLGTHAFFASWSWNLKTLSELAGHDPKDALGASWS